MLFSERIGAKPPKTPQIESMDDELKTALWNCTYGFFLKPNYHIYWLKDNETLHKFFLSLWVQILKRPVDELDNAVVSSLFKELKSLFLQKWSWHEAYNFIEFLAGSDYFDSTTFKNCCNQMLEKEFSGYRFIGNTITPITNASEVAEIEKAIENSTEKNLSGVKTHLESALSKLSDKTKPDYRNSIKESISAVEALCCKIAKDPNATLGKALAIIEATGKISLHGALKSGFSSIYGYTSDGDGIRHALIEESKLSPEDAKYMLISCSAFINYLIIKADKAGIDLN